MFLEQREINRRKAFEHLVEIIKGQNKDTIVFCKEFQYSTKRGKIHKYIPVNSITEAIEKYPNQKLERCNGFNFVQIK